MSIHQHKHIYQQYHYSKRHPRQFQTFSSSVSQAPYKATFHRGTFARNTFRERFQVFREFCDFDSGTRRGDLTREMCAVRRDAREFSSPICRFAKTIVMITLSGITVRKREIQS